MRIVNILLIFTGLLLVSCSSSDNSNTNSDSESNSISKPDKSKESTVFLGEIGIPDGMYTFMKVAPIITWTAKKITGSGHTGVMPMKAGKMKIENGQIARGLINFDMNAFEVTDIEGEDKTDFDKHLKSSDFLDVKNYPSAFLIFNGSFIDEKGMNIALCTLDMHGLKVNYELPFTTESYNVGIANGFKVKGQLLLDRTKHNIKYHSSSFFDKLGDKVIDDEILISFEVIAL